MTCICGLTIGVVLAAAASVAHAADDPVRGEQQFAPCTACHTVAAGGPNMTGPNLHGVFGKKAGTNQARTFDYPPP